MTLLRAAFSHNGFAPAATDLRIQEGFFRSVVTEKRVAGPVPVSHSTKDWAVGVAYPLAPRVAGQPASALGDARDTFGGPGRNGPVRTAESTAQAFGKVGMSYAFKSHTLYGMDANKLIKGHSGIVYPETAYALLHAMS